MNKFVLFAWLTTGLGVLASINNTYIKDRYSGLCFFYYAFPFILISAIFVLSGLLWWRLRRYLLRTLCFVACVPCALVWFSSSWNTRLPLDLPLRVFKVIVWNTRYIAGEDPRVVTDLFKLRADLIVLPESNGLQQLVEQESLAPEGYSVHEFEGGVSIIARGEIRPIESYLIGTRSRIAVVELVIDQRTIPIVTVDMESNPFLSRREAFEILDSLLNKEPMLVLGDFNTPTESVWFEEVFEKKHRYGHAFTDSGYGYNKTWPKPLPILALDHIWTRPDITSYKTELRPGKGSDHRMLFSTIALPIKKVP